MTLLDQRSTDEVVAEVAPVVDRLRRLTGIGEDGPELLPLDAGEQYRFSFAMDACVGCHSCEAACAEQNATPVDGAWRRVGELEGGVFPLTKRLNLSMACNHCLEPTCLSGCPTEAYTKLQNGVVRHDAAECIGCQYCIWNCPYEVPVYDKAAKVVAKCDMCLPRLEQGQSPACVLACPTHAITVEPVNVAAWRADYTEAEAPGLPPASITLSTTRLVLPAGLASGPELVPATDHSIQPEDPHWPLVALTLLTQLSLGTVAATVVAELAGGAGRSGLAGGAVGAAIAGAVALGASLFHLGRPTHAFKALRNLRTSWLSREVALLSLFSGASLAYAAAWMWAEGSGAGRALRLVLGVGAVAAGLAGIYASGRLYLVPARPVWNSRRTLVAFFATALSTGPLLALLCLDRSRIAAGVVLALMAAAAAGALAQLGVQAQLVRTLRARSDRQHRGTAQLLEKRFRGLQMARPTAAVTTLALLAWTLDSPLAGTQAGGRIATALFLAALGELAGRYLFYVTVVPYRVAGSFFSGR
ncbi:MAG TPA: DmsC/YnfH family molybdoenzyme membrane anchor subunit [Acidimicrobiales bacterium]|nr:DmsC/YnfH family molybdoenzyme membrane anchor subunit [Acidimicrobiales bacterium]